MPPTPPPEIAAPSGRAASSKLGRYSTNSIPPLKNPGYAPDLCCFTVGSPSAMLAQQLSTCRVCLEVS